MGAAWKRKQKKHRAMTALMPVLIVVIVKFSVVGALLLATATVETLMASTVLALEMAVAFERA
jgi:hypothetical protein